MSELTRRIVLGGALAASVTSLFVFARGYQRQNEIEALFAKPLAAPEGPMPVYHLGHSLVGRDMPAMLAQLAGHEYNSQLGWGTSLREHFEPDLPINGFETENDHPRYRDAREALASGEYRALVLTEMVEIKDAIRYHDSARYLRRWAELARDTSPDMRVFLYETWHHRDDPAGWLARINSDLQAHWLDEVLYPARDAGPIHLIPAGQVMAAFVRAAQDAGGVPGIEGVEDLMARNEDGTVDTIHLNDLGAYLVALTHYAVLYHRDPTGVPHNLNRADGSPANAPSDEAAALMQSVVWDVVRRHRQTGVPA